ncbi:hypothetical protein [Streptomyces mirabilis]|uniref:hypothetical protein n=1 Tax=Streptomyces mirabilis TaxID=68239 RepID=UPI00340F6F75
MSQPTDQPVSDQTADTTDAIEPAGPTPCRCGSTEHAAIRIGDQLSPTGSAVRTVYVCPAVSATGLDGVL